MFVIRSLGLLMSAKLTVDVQVLVFFTSDLNVWSKTFA